MSATAPTPGEDLGRLTIDLDTGGTFTDGYVSGAARTIRAKVDTTPHDLTEGILRCIDHAAEQAGLTRTQLLRHADAVRLSTTVGTNAILNRSGARVGLLIAKDLHASIVPRLPETLPILRALIEPLPEATAADADSATVAALRRLLERGARIVVVALDEGRDLAEREKAVRSFIAGEYPRHYLGAVPVLPSHEVTLTPDPFIRVCTAVLDAYLHPLMARFLYRVEDELRKSGYARPLLVAQSNGGTSRVAKTTALRTWGSGPAGGVAGAAALAAALGLESVVSIDVGGTSTDVAVLRGGRWTESVEPEIEGIRVSLPVLGLESIGIGGGSIAALEGGELRVGPNSAGAQPGPAAFGLGGEDPTVTDAVCCLGVFDPANFLGGRKRLDPAAARRAVERKIAEPLATSVETAALRIVRTAARTVADEIAKTLEARGLRAAETWLFATGGAGGLLAAAITVEAGLAGACAFPLSPVFSAFGLSRLDLLHAYDAQAGAADLRGRLEDLVERARRDFRGEGVDPSTASFRLEAEVGDSNGRVEALDLGEAEDLGAALSRAQALGRRLRLLRLKVSSPGHRSDFPRRAEGRAEPAGSRAVYWTTRIEPTPVFAWDALPAGATLVGPAIVESAETTLAIPPGTRGVVGALGEVRISGAEEGRA